MIRKAVRTAFALATSKERVPVAFVHLQAALKASEDFEADLKGYGAVESLSSYN